MDKHILVAIDERPLRKSCQTSAFAIDYRKLFEIKIYLVFIFDGK